MSPAVRAFEPRLHGQVQAAPLTRRTANLLTAVVLLAIGVATMVPAGAPASEVDATPGLGVEPADLVRNLLFFIPFGLCLGLRGDGFRTALAVGVGVSVTIEIAQLGVAGRISSPWDVVGNGAGALAGWAAVVTRNFWLFPRPTMSNVLCLGLGLAAAFVFWATEKAAVVSVPFEKLYAHLPAEQPHLARFSGGDLAAWLDGQRLPRNRIYDAKPVRAALSGDFALRVGALLGEPSAGPMNFFMITAQTSPIVTLEIDGKDLLYRYWTRAGRAGFEPGVFRLEGLLEGVGPGDRVDIRVSRRGPETCVSLGDDERCDIGSSAADGWAFFIPLFITDRVPATWIRWGWVVLFFGPIGYWMRPNPIGWLALAAAAGSMVLSSGTGTLLPFSWHQAVPMAFAVGAGHGLRIVTANLVGRARRS